MSDPLRWRWPLGALAVCLFAILLLEDFVIGGEPITALDLLFDAMDLGLLIACTTAVVVLLLKTREREEQHRLLREDVRLVQLASERWRREMDEHLRGLGAAMQQQFQAWGLSRAEQDVALLLLKGFSHKEIARLRRSSEATVRQQAAQIYQKANLGGRAGLAAFFLEGLFLPEPASCDAPAKEGTSAHADQPAA